MNHLLEVNHLYKSYHGTQVLSDISMSMNQGEMTVILGPSGCGKSTLLRCLAGLENVSNGQILLNNKDITHVKPEHRPIVLMFQHPLLFIHMTIIENVMFGLKQKKINKKNRKALAMEMLIKTEIAEYADRFPNELSGGQQQRVALARALVMKPSLLLLDEPFSSLDQHLKESIREWVCHLLKEEGITTLIVTHDKEEAMLIGNHIILIKNGQIQQQGRPMDVYQYPENKQVEVMFSDGLDLNDTFYPSQRLTLTPAINQESSHAISSGIISNHLYKFGLCFYQVQIKKTNQKVMLHSAYDFKIGDDVLIWYSEK